MMAKLILLRHLLRQGYGGQEGSGGQAWTEAHMRYLRHLTLPDAAHNRVLEDNLTTIDFHHQRIAKLETEQCQTIGGTLDGAQRSPKGEGGMRAA